MSELLASPFFGIALSILAFWVGVRIQKKTGLVVCNPLLIGIVLVVGVLLLFRIPYESYHQGGEIINMFLAPATACLAVAIYGKIRILKENWLPILVGCVVGSASSMGSILLLCRLFGLDAAMTASLLPKSVTTPIAISVSQAHGGIGPITVVAVLITGIFGSIAAPLLIKLFRVKDPMTAGLAIGASSHAVGTSKALELGETEGAMSGLAIGVCGLITVVLSLFLMSRNPYAPADGGGAVCRKSGKATFSRKPQSAARRVCPPVAARPNTCSLRSVFPDAHVTGETRLVLDSRLRARTLRGIFDILASPPTGGGHLGA